MAADGGTCGHLMIYIHDLNVIPVSMEVKCKGNSVSLGPNTFVFKSIYCTLWTCRYVESHPCSIDHSIKRTIHEWPVIADLACCRVKFSHHKKYVTLCNIHFFISLQLTHKSNVLHPWTTELWLILRQETLNFHVIVWSTFIAQSQNDVIFLFVRTKYLKE